METDEMNTVSMYAHAHTFNDISPFFGRIQNGKSYTLKWLDCTYHIK